MTKEDERGKGECNLPVEPEQSKVLHLGIPIASRTPLNNPLPCKARDMTPSPENETCEETSRRTQGQESQNERAWMDEKVNQRTGSGAERESDERRRRPWPVAILKTKRTEWPPTGTLHPLHERGSPHKRQERTTWTSWSHH